MISIFFITASVPQLHSKTIKNLRQDFRSIQQDMLRFEYHLNQLQENRTPLHPRFNPQIYIDVALQEIPASKEFQKKIERWNQTIVETILKNLDPYCNEKDPLFEASYQAWKKLLTQLIEQFNQNTKLRNKGNQNLLKSFWRNEFPYRSFRSLVQNEDDRTLWENMKKIHELNCSSSSCVIS